MTILSVTILILLPLVNAQGCAPWGIRLSLGEYYSDIFSDHNLFITFNTDNTCSQSYVNFEGNKVACSVTPLSNPLAHFATTVHVCKINGLTWKGRSYYDASYRVVGMEAGGPEWTRELISIKLVNRNIKDSWKCLVIGDWGILSTMKETYYDIFPLLKQLNDTFAAFIFLGDMAYDLCDYNETVGYEDSCIQYPAFLKAIEFITSKIPFMPTLGNHEDGPRLVYTHLFAVASFPVPGNINQYSFEIGNVRFQTVNFYDEAKLNVTSGLSAKMEWLESDYQRRSPQVDWVIPFGHYPFYCGLYKNDTGCATRHYDTILQPFLSYLTHNKISLYLGAHIHYFRRSLPITLDEKIGTAEIIRNETMTVYRNPKAPTFIIEGSGGCNYYVELEKSPLENYTDVQYLNTGFSIFTSHGDSKMIQNDHYLGKDGSLADSFAIEFVDETLATAMVLVGAGFAVGLLVVLYFIVRESPKRRHETHSHLLASEV